MHYGGLNTAQQEEADSRYDDPEVDVENVASSRLAEVASSVDAT